jgi:hypothetical protein
LFNGNSVIRNCEIRNFNTGIFMEVHNYDVQIVNSLLTHNAVDGLRTSHHNYRTTIQGSRASFNGNVGLNLTDWAQNGRVVSSSSNHNGQEGIRTDSFGTLFTCGSEVRGNGAACGLLVWNSATYGQDCQPEPFVDSACGAGSARSAASTRTAPRGSVARASACRGCPPTATGMASPTPRNPPWA